MYVPHPETLLDHIFTMCLLVYYAHSLLYSFLTYILLWSRFPQLLILPFPSFFTLPLISYGIRCQKEWIVVNRLSVFNEMEETRDTWIKSLNPNSEESPDLITMVAPVGTWTIEAVATQQQSKAMVWVESVNDDLLLAKRGTLVLLQNMSEPPWEPCQWEWENFGGRGFQSWRW